MKKYWRCFVCNDIHYGVKPPEVCPTCRAVNAFVEVSSAEAGQVSSPRKTLMDKEGFREAIDSFASRNEFQVNPDREKVDLLLEGIFENEKTCGLKYCPCRLRTKEFEEDLKIVCPCNFLIHETYNGKPEGECWCGLFIRRRS
jgi:ferredoxin-thioredoxin reductase catalytic chain